ncbi:MAG: hypothetical protein WBR13_12385 [Allosphingosinicella sp.]
MAFLIATPAGAQDRRGECEGLVVSGDLVAVTLPPKTPARVTVCNLNSGQCSDARFRGGALASRIRTANGDLLSVRIAGRGRPCLVTARKPNSQLMTILPAVVAGLVGVIGALLGAWTNSYLSRSGQREVVVNRWRARMIERAEIVAASGVGPLRISYPENADDETFERIRTIKQKADDIIRALPPSATATQISLMAKKVTELLSKRG